MQVYYYSDYLSFEFLFVCVCVSEYFFVQERGVVVVIIYSVLPAHHSNMDKHTHRQTDPHIRPTFTHAHILITTPQFTLGVCNRGRLC